MNTTNLPPLPPLPQPPPVPPPDPRENGPAPAPTRTEPTGSEPGGTDGENLRGKARNVEFFSLLNATKISLYKNSFEGESGVAISLAELLQGIQRGTWEGPITRARHVFATEGKDHYSREKTKFPAVALSGVIRGARKKAVDEGRFQHSGILQIDLDLKDHPGMTVDEMKRRCKNSAYSVFVATSPSGAGVKAAIRIEKDPDSHLNSFRAAEQHFKQLGLTIDPSTKDAARLMFVSFDPALWINPALPPVLPPLQESDPAPSPRREHTHKHEREGECNSAGSGGCVLIHEIREVLEFIPKRPTYGTWIIVAFAVFSCAPYEDAIALLKEWSPEEEPGEYEKLHKSEHSGKKVGFGTLVAMAREHGYNRASKIPKDVIPLNGGEIGYRQSNRVIFECIAPTKRLFMRGNTVVEIVEDTANGASIVEMTPERFVEFVETLGKRVAQREFQTLPGGGGENTPRRIKWRTKTMSLQAAKIALQSEAARELLPPLRQIANAPVIVDVGDGKCEILAHGYHLHAGGTFVTSGVKMQPFRFERSVAVFLLKSLLADFDFATPSDCSRAIASLIGPALKMGGILGGDFPLDVAEAEQSQSGKTFLCRMVTALYNEIPSVITARRGGVGSLDESVANALLAGRMFVSIDNMRGTIDSPLLETALRGHGCVECRGYRANARVDVTPFIWQLSTNGAELTRDLANRSVIIRIRKRPAGYVFRSYPEGNVLAHIGGRRSSYLSAVFEVVREWVARGKPRTNDNRHDFGDWARSLDWIVQNILDLPPLLDGHREEQLRTANPKLQWLRDILHRASASDFGRQFTTSQILEIADNAGIELPGGTSSEHDTVRAGKILAGLFGQAGGDTLDVDGFTVIRTRVQVVGDHGFKTQNVYTFEKRS